MKLYAKLTDPKNGWDDDKDRAEEFLKTHDEEEILLVNDVAIGRSSTSIDLVGHGNHWNSVQFTFFVESKNGLVEYDIFKNKSNLPQIYSNYGGDW